MNIVKWTVIPLVIFSTLVISNIALAKDDVGTMIAIRNKAIIERDKKEIEAKVRDNILLKDTVSTLEASRAKMLFIDDSVLTLGEKSRAVIREFIYSKDKGGKAIFNLIDGKMRSVVGKASFEVHTPTAVAAARGTVILFETGIRDGRQFTTIICLEGEVNITSADPKIAGIITLTPGTMITIFEREPLPIPATAPATEVERLKKDTDIIRHEISVPGPMEIEVAPARIVIEHAPLISPPVEQQPISTTPVTIDVKFPE